MKKSKLIIFPFMYIVYPDGVVTKNLVPLAVPLLLYDSDLRRVLNGTGSLLFAFIVGAFSTIVGTVITYPLIPLKSLGIDQGWRVASALAARHIGGAINFVAVADTLNVVSDHAISFNLVNVFNVFYLKILIKRLI